MVCIMRVDRAEIACDLLLAMVVEPLDQGLELLACDGEGERHPAIAFANQDEEVGRRITLGGVHLAKADLSCTLVELGFLVDAPAQVKGKELIALGRTIGVQIGEHQALKNFALFTEIRKRRGHE
jgi:hypothetical protein